MPHVVLNGKIAIQDIFDSLSPLSIRDEKKILRTYKKYIDGEAKSILVEALAIEDGNKTNFFALLDQRKDGLVLRIYPGYAVEKTEGVKKILAELSKKLMEKFPDLNIGNTNLQEFLYTNVK